MAEEDDDSGPVAGEADLIGLRGEGAHLGGCGDFLWWFGGGSPGLDLVGDGGAYCFEEGGHLFGGGGCSC